MCRAWWIRPFPAVIVSASQALGVSPAAACGLCSDHRILTRRKACPDLLSAADASPDRAHESWPSSAPAPRTVGLLARGRPDGHRETRRAGLGAGVWGRLAVLQGPTCGMRDAGRAVGGSQRNRLPRQRLWGGRGGGLREAHGGVPSSGAVCARALSLRASL